MAPLLEQNNYATATGYLTPEELSIPLVDSSFETRKQPANFKTMAERDQPAKARKASHSPTKQSCKNDNAEKNSGLRFMIVDHPDQLKDKAEMRKNRTHVMQTYLAKEAQNPDSKDSRVTGGRGDSKRKHSRKEISPKGVDDMTLNSHAPSNIFRRDISRLTPAESVESNNNSIDTFDREPSDPSAKSSRKSAFRREKHVNIAANERHELSLTTQRRPLVQGIGGYFENSQYMRAAIEDIPFTFRSSHPRDILAARLEPFGKWPSFSDPALDVNELKWKCSQRFGSESLSMHWIPTILRARHAFLSTLCISSSHDDIMTRALLPPHLHNGESLERRWKVRSGVIQMINESISDPDMRIADETIIAVLHVLNSEVMGCNDQSMRIHQSGLLAMVRERGGLHKLGAGGQLGFMLTITDYMIAALRENVPQREYTDFASKADTKIPSGAQRVPESPVYNRAQGFHTIRAILEPHNPMYQLLNTLRSLTNSFYIENSQPSRSGLDTCHTRRSRSPSNETVASLYAKVFAFAPASEQDFGSMGDRYTYEGVRLAALIYAQALANKISFSRAASQTGTNSSPDTAHAQAEPIPIQIKQALMRTDVSYCWDHLAGVLFWTSLVAGAAANPGPLANEDRIGDDEDARKWLTAIAVRCCIVLSFEYGASVLETLKRFVAIETVLARSDSTSDPLTDVLVQDTGIENTVGHRQFGPAVPPPLQRGFADFAQEFLSI